MRVEPWTVGQDDDEEVGQVQDALAGRRALVTGGATGIGRAVALALARAGADVALTHLAHDATDVVAEIKELGRESAAVQVDLRRSWDVDEAVASAAESLGGSLDILVNNVGGLVERRGIATMDDAHWHGVLDLNLSSAFYATQGRPQGDAGRRADHLRRRAGGAQRRWHGHGRVHDREGGDRGLLPGARA